MEEHFKTAPKNATYRSKTTQNEIIRICGEVAQEKIIGEIKQAKFFSILADEAADISNIEQMPVVVRFVDNNSVIREEFLSFVPCKLGLSGEAIATTLIDAMNTAGLDMELCRGQGYDGAGNMAGRCSGAAVRIQRQFPKASCVHCGSHTLNLCVASACNIQVIQNMMNHVRVISQFFNAHPKRFALLKKTVEDILPGVCHSHLINVCRTRWVERIDGLDVLIEIFIAVVTAFETIKDNVDKSWNTDSVRDAWFSVSCHHILPVHLHTCCRVVLLGSHKAPDEAAPIHHV